MYELALLALMALACLLYAIRVRKAAYDQYQQQERYDSSELQREVVQTLIAKMVEGERTGSYTNRHFYTAFKSELHKCNSPADFDIQRVEKDLRASRRKRYEAIFRSNKDVPK